MQWQAGDHVIVRGAEWRIAGVTTFTDCQSLDLDGARGATRTLLVPFDRPRRPPRARLTVVSRRHWARAVRAAVLRSHPYRGLRSCPHSVRLLAYQVEPALAILRHGATRVLIADGVGLGKTIEAGFVVRELASQDRGARVLILCPAALCSQWAQEMQRLFELHVVRADAGWLRRMVREVPPDVNPWSLPGVYLASIDFVKRPEALGPLEDVRWDLLVVDEAHVATCGSDRRVAIDALAQRARRLVLLTATPHSGDDEQFRALCALGRAGDPLVFFSRERSDTPLEPAALRSRVLPVRLTDEEHRVHRLLDEYTRRLWARAERAGCRDARLVAAVLSKRALSSPASLALSVRRRRALLMASPAPPAQMMLPLTDEPIDDGAPDGILGAAGLDDAGEEGRILDAIAAAAETAARNERKVCALIRLIRRVREPALIFSEYRDTAMRLCRVLAAAGHSVALLHGGLADDERRRAVAALASGRSHLVATDAASEGLNLQQACRLVVHFELPWTPARLHQRCGRVDRIGQTRRVHEIALVARDTSEQLVIAPLVARAARAGSMRRQPLLRRLGESQVAAHVLGGRPLECATFELPRGTMRMDLRTEARAEVDRLELLRRLDSPGASPWKGRRSRMSGIPVTALRRSRVLTAALYVVFDMELRQGAGAPLMREVLVLSCDVRIDGPRSRAALRQFVGEAIDGNEQLSSLVARIRSDRLEAVRPLWEEATRRLRAREQAAERSLRSAAAELVQAGLFDRRALDAGARRRNARDRHAEHERARMAALAGDGALEATHTLAAVLIVGGAS